jgi:hypothetical protein
LLRGRQRRRDAIRIGAQLFLRESIMSTQKEESSKAETSEQQPKAPQSGELREEHLDQVTGGTGGGSTAPIGPHAPGG